MKAVILAGGLGSRLSEETTLRPKPMIEIGGKPVLWHIMKLYSFYGINDFIICLGYKGNMIKEYFANYRLYSSDVQIDVKYNSVGYRNNSCEPWIITLVDTGLDTMTGGRLKRVLPFVASEEMFCFTYGDGVSNVNLHNLIEFHKSRGQMVSLTAVQPRGRFGNLSIDDNDRVLSFSEKPTGDGRWINGGYFVLSPKVGDYIQDDSTVWEREPIEMLAKTWEVGAYKHTGFWHPMDTVHDKESLESIWNSGAAPWEVWK